MKTHFRSLFRLFAALSLFTLFPHTVFAQTSAQAVFSVINERLSYMEDVALYKALHYKAIEDVEREVKVIKSASQAAEKAGLKSNSVEAFFKAQIAVAKAIQYRYRADLLSQPTMREPLDLQSIVRPKLIALGAKTNQLLARHLTQHGAFSDADFTLFSQSISVKYVSDADKRMLFNALKHIELQ